MHLTFIKKIFKRFYIHALPPNDFIFVKQDVNVCCFKTDTLVEEEATLSASELSTFCKSGTGTMSKVMSSKT